MTFLGAPVFRKKVRCHFTPDFNALNLRQVALVLQILPVRFVQFGPDQEVKLSNLVIFSDQSGSETQLAMTFNQTDDFAEHLSGHHLHLVEDQQAPVDILNLLHLSLLIFISSALKRNHAVS